MSEWLAALPGFLLVLALVLVPGVGSAYAVGLRGLAAWGAGPAMGMTVLTAAPVAAQLLGLVWSPRLLIASAAAWVLAAAVIGWLLRLWRPVTRVRQPRRTQVASVVAVGLGVLAVLGAALPGMGTPDELVDSTDAVAHLNRIRAFLDTGDFSSLGPSTYPSGFHAIAASAMQVLPQLGIVEAANLAALTAAAVIWPLGCVALARHTFSHATIILLGAGLASAAFTTFPFMLMGWGVLWPNLLATALFPGALVPALVATGTLRPTATLSRPVAAVVTVLLVPGLTLSHPNSLVALAMVVVLALMAAAANRAARTYGNERGRALAALAALLAAVVAALVAAPRLSRQIADTASYDFATTEGLGGALREVVLLSLQIPSALWGLVLVLLAGLVACARRPRQRWVVVTYAVCVVLYVLAATSRTPLGVLLTGYWYNDKVRLSALATVPAMLLVVAGIAVVARGLRRVLVGFTPASPPLAPHHTVLRIMVAAGTLVAFVLGTVVVNHDAATSLTKRYYRPPQADHVLITPQERTDLGQLARLLPDDAVTAGVPANGSAFLYALYDRPVLFDSLLLNPDPDSALIGLHLKEALRRTDVCDALRRKNVQYAVTGPVRYWLSLSERTVGLAALGDTPGFAEIGRAGRYRLYRITACGFGSGPGLA